MADNDYGDEYTEEGYGTGTGEGLPTTKSGYCTNGVYMDSDQQVPTPNRFPGDPSNHAHYKSLAAGRHLMNYAPQDDPSVAEDQFDDWFLSGGSSGPVNNPQEF